MVFPKWQSVGFQKFPVFVFTESMIAFGIYAIIISGYLAFFLDLPFFPTTLAPQMVKV